MLGMLELAWPILVLVLLYVVVGGTLAWLIGLRGLWLVAAAPVFTTTVVGIASVLTGVIGMNWSLLPVLAVGVLIGAAIAIVRRFTSAAPRTKAGKAGWWTTAALAGAAIVLGIRLALVIGDPQAISQTFDNVFHLNAVRWILDTGGASPLEIGHMISPEGGVPFYPSAWHATGAIVVQLSGAGIPQVSNAQTLVIGALVWPAGAMLLARVLAGTSRVVTVVAAVVAISVPAFPVVPMDYGVLYPMQLGLAMVPFALAVTAALLRIGFVPHALPWGWWALALAGALPGLALAHPGGFLGWLALSVPMILAFAWRLWATGGARLRIVVLAAVLAYPVVGVLLLKVLRPPLLARLWETTMSVPEAIWKALTLQLFYPVPALVIAVLILAGIVLVFWRERTTANVVAIGIWFIGAVLFVVVTSSPNPTIRDALTGGWYNNWPRLAAVFGVALVPLAVVGGSRVVAAIGGLLSKRISAKTLAATGAVCGLVALVVVPLPAYAIAGVRAGNTYVYDNDSRLLSDDELALLQRLDDEVPADAVIAGNPYTGTSLAYALADREVLMRHILVDLTPEMEEVNDHLRDADEDPDVCAAVRELGVEYVLDFGDREVHKEAYHPLPGLLDLADSDAVRLVDQQGDAKLYAVTACGIG